MRLNTKTRYAVRAMLTLALREQDSEPVSASDIAESEEISVKYLEGLLGSLRAAGLVRSVRGASGGYRLARSAADITLRQIYHVFEGSEGFVICTNEPGVCGRSGRCAAQTVWDELYQLSMRYLESVSLADLVVRNHRCQTDAPTYDI